MMKSILTSSFSKSFKMFLCIKTICSFSVGFLPTVRVWPVKRTKEEGKNAHFYCFAGGQQTPIIAWSRESGEPMSRRVFIRGRRLLIRGVKKEDGGTYLCTARNTYGSEIAAGKLTVKGKKYLFIIYGLLFM